MVLEARTLFTRSFFSRVNVTVTTGTCRGADRLCLRIDTMIFGIEQCLAVALLQQSWRASCNQHYQGCRWRQTFVFLTGTRFEELKEHLIGGTSGCRSGPCKSTELNAINILSKCWVKDIENIQRTPLKNCWKSVAISTPLFTNPALP